MAKSAFMKDLTPSTELAKVVGTSHRMIAYYEIQGGNPPSDVVVNLARALGVTTDELLGVRTTKRAGSEQTPEDLRLLRRLRQVSKLPAKERRNVLQFIDALVDRETLKKANG